jgi:hypothetical protein
VPALFLVVIVLIYGRMRNRVLLNRFLIGYIGGFLGSLAVLLIMLPGMLIGITPDLTGTLGKMMLGVPLNQPTTPATLAAGAVYHFFLNGAAWGAAYALLFGKSPWWFGTLYGLGVQAVLMVSPSFYFLGFSRIPMQYGAVILVLLTAAHLAYGTIIGYVVYKHVFPEMGVEGSKAIRPTYV